MLEPVCVRLCASQVRLAPERLVLTSFLRPVVTRPRFFNSSFSSVTFKDLMSAMVLMPRAVGGSEKSTFVGVS